MIAFFKRFAVAVAMAGVLVSSAASASTGGESLLPRKFLAFYHGPTEKTPRYSPTHQYLEMPANHLGFDIIYHDLEKPLPEVLDDEYRAVVVWLNIGVEVKDPAGWLLWLEKQAEAGKKIIIIENLGVSDKFLKKEAGVRAYNHFLLKIGIKDTIVWNSLTYNAETLSINNDMIGFERSLPAALPAYSDTIAVQGLSKSHLKVRIDKESEVTSDLVITSTKGGWIAPGYAIFEGYPLVTPKDKKKKNPKDAASGLVKKKRENKLYELLTAEEKAKLNDDEKLKLAHRRKKMATAGDVRHDVAISKQAKLDGKTGLVGILAKRAAKEEAALEDEEDETTLIQQWYVNPFLFLRTILHDENEPKADVTTLNGKRIFYSHIDGDGWNNISHIRRYRLKKVISAEVVRKEVLERYPDIPTNVSIVTSDIDPNCYGVKESADVAREVFKLSNVEPSSHTHSHPLDWGFFEHGMPKKEIELLHTYPDKPADNKGLYSFVMGSEEAEIEGDATGGSWSVFFDQHKDLKAIYEKSAKKKKKAKLKSKYYDTPRSYACVPFSVEHEIVGAIDIINALSPEGKKARLVQWSGDTSPYETVLRVTRENGFLNINGGDSRYDSEYPSYSSVSPVGLHVGKEQQIYSSNSNENTYTNLWTGRFFGFRYLQMTVDNTERPRRVQPFNIYYHMYSGERQASLNAVRENIEYARTQNIIPVMASRFAEVANGFFTVDFQNIGKDAWRVLNRGHLQTIRFDDAIFKAVDINKSKGVLGFNYFQGNLYVSLDPAVETAEIRLKSLRRFGYAESFSRPYLLDSSWEIKDLTFINKTLIFRANGYGTSRMRWQMPRNSSKTYIVNLYDGDNKKLSFERNAGIEGSLELDIDPQGNEWTRVEILPKD